MAVPQKPAAGAPIAADWGAVVHDTAAAQDIQIGTGTVNFNNSNQANVTVTFPRPFASTPIVCVGLASTAGASLGLIPQMSSVSPTQVGLRLSQASGNAITSGPYSVMYIAIGPRA